MIPGQIATKNIWAMTVVNTSFVAPPSPLSREADIYRLIRTTERAQHLLLQRLLFDGNGDSIHHNRARPIHRDKGSL
jgi:hypothetical protein